MLDLFAWIRDTKPMNKLSTEKRAQILSMLVEGMSMRSITRITGVSINTVAKLLNDAGDACAAYHDAHVRGIKGNRRIECDEIWSFCYAKEKMVPRAKKAPKEAGDVWTWTAIDADSKLMLSYHVTNERDGQSALTVMDDLRQRLEGRPQITTERPESLRRGDRGILRRGRGLRPGHQGIRQDERRLRAGTQVQPFGLHEDRKAEGAGRTGSVIGKHNLRRAPQSHDADGRSPLHSAYQRIQQADRETRRDGFPVRLALQLLPDSQDVEGHARDGCGDRDKVA